MLHFLISSVCQKKRLTDDKAIWILVALYYASVFSHIQKFSKNVCFMYWSRSISFSGMADCVMALGFEKMQRGSLKGTVRIFFEIVFHLSWNYISISKNFYKCDKMGITVHATHVYTHALLHKVLKCQQNVQVRFWSDEPLHLFSDR